MVLPDTNFRNKLIQSYPSVMLGDKLNIAAANNFVFDLLIDSSNIKDLTGVEHFISIYKLSAIGNQIKKIPDISNYKNLKYLWVSINQLDSLPNLSKLTKLIELQAGKNKITFLPNLDNLQNLDFILVPDNQIKRMPNLSKLSKLKRLYFGNNPLDSFPDLSNNKALTELQCHLLKFDKIPNLDSLVNLEVLYCDHSNLETLEGLSRNTKLRILDANYNKLLTLPNLSNKPKLRYLNVKNNKLTFEDLLPLSNNGITNFFYSQQDSIGEQSISNLREYRIFEIVSPVDLNVQNQKFSFYKNGNLIQNSSSNQLTISRTSKNDAGIYFLEISNSQLPDLTLYGKSNHLKVLNCMDVNQFEVNISNQECGKGIDLEVLHDFKGAVKPFNFSFKKIDLPNQNAASNQNGIFEKLTPGIYNLTFSDSFNCKTNKEVILNKPNSCDVILSFTNENTPSSYFIEEKGVVKIIDMSGKVVQQLNAPVVWNGQRSDGILVDTGYYVILLNDQKLTNITVIR